VTEGEKGQTVEVFSRANELKGWGRGSLLVLTGSRVWQMECMTEVEERKRSLVIPGAKN
jgi:hypothetical protein